MNGEAKRAILCLALMLLISTALNVVEATYCVWLARELRAEKRARLDDQLEQLRWLEKTRDEMGKARGK